MKNAQAKIDGDFVDVEWWEGEDKHNLLIKPEDIVKNHRFWQNSEKENPSVCPNCGGKDWHHSTECYLGEAVR